MKQTLRAIALFVTASSLLLADDGEYEAIQRAAGRVSGAVVQIETIGAGTGGSELSLNAPISGTVVDPKGYIVTSLWGLEENPASILAVLPDGSRLPAELIAKDFSRELAVLKVDAPDQFASVDLATKNPVTVGQWAIAIGRGITPEQPALSVGIVSATDRMYGRAVQIDARISPSFYGGPVVDIRGTVIGISVPMKPDAGSAGEKAQWYDSGIAFVVPAEAIQKRLEQLISGNDINPGKLGIVPSSKLPFSTDRTLSAVLALSPAKKAGILVGDELIAIDGRPVRRIGDVKQILGPKDAGENVKVKIRRDGKEMEVDVRLAADIPTFRPRVLGILASSDEKGFLVDFVFPNSPADAAEIRAGDIITIVDGVQPKSLDQFRLQVMTSPSQESISLTVLRNGGEVEVTCNLDQTPPNIVEQLPALPQNWPKDEWEVLDRALPAIANKALLLTPKAKDATDLSLLVLLARPGDEDLSEILDAWIDTAAEQNLAVLAIGASEEKRWKPTENDSIIQMIQHVTTGLDVSDRRIVIGGYGAGAEMSLMVALRNREIVRGAVTRAGTRPGGFSLSENDPANPVEILVVGGQEIPVWGRIMAKAGIPVILEKSTSKTPLEDASIQKAVCRWVRSLDRI